MSVGCKSTFRRKNTTTTQSDRLVAAYPDLSTGRFWVIADFEQLDHYQLFHVDSHSRAATCMVSSSLGVEKTGAHCLQVTLADPLDTLVVSNANSKSWSLRRDWREFYLLIGSVYCPLDSAKLLVAIEGGSQQETSVVHARVHLNKGWNTIRLDLAEAAERVEIDEVREIRFSLPDISSPVELRFDDLALVDNREALFGSPDDSDEGLYIERCGRRWNIGAAGRFELGFANGQIVHWFDLGSDPHKVRNLVGNGVLGPSPVVLPGIGERPDGSEADFASLGDTVVARQRVLEANETRIVISCTMRFSSTDRAPGEQDPFHEWTYTILPTGRVFVHFACTTRLGDWAPEDIGLAVSRVDDPRLEAFAHRAAQLEVPKELRHVAFGYLAPRAPDQSGLLMIMHDARKSPIVQVFHQREAELVSVLASGGYIEDATQSWSCLLDLWPPGNCRDAAAKAVDYCNPDGVNVLVGKLATDSVGDANGDGFDEQLGAYVLEPDADLLRFEVDTSRGPRFAPVISVPGTADRQVWVYVNNAILEQTSRDREGNLLFQLPGTVNRRTLVEVILRSGPTKPSA